MAKEIKLNFITESKNIGSRRAHFPEMKERLLNQYSLYTKHSFTRYKIQNFKIAAEHKIRVQPNIYGVFFQGYVHITMKYQNYQNF